MKNHGVKIVLIMLSLILFTSCGKEAGTKRSNTESVQDNLDPEDMNVEGTYKAVFTTLNPHVNGSIPGGVTFFRKEDRLYAYVRLFAGGPRVWHQQNVYTGGRCPTLADDENKDGYIDIIEARKVLGNILIPLDSDIGSQASGKRFFPLSDLSGSYAYERVTSFSKFLNDLKAPDPDPTDNIVKIGENEGFTFAGKTVMVQGTSNKIDYPDTVASEKKYKPYQTLPIVCATFKKDDSVVGFPLDDAIPGPVGPVVDNQDRPAPSGAGEYYPPTPGTEHGTGSNTNTEGENSEGRNNTDPEDYGNRGG